MTTVLNIISNNFGFEKSGQQEVISSSKPLTQDFIAGFLLGTYLMNCVLMRNGLKNDQLLTALLVTSSSTLKYPCNPIDPILPELRTYIYGEGNNFSIASPIKKEQVDPTRPSFRTKTFNWVAADIYHEIFIGFNFASEEFMIGARVPFDSLGNKIENISYGSVFIRPDNWVNITLQVEDKDNIIMKADDKMIPYKVGTKRTIFCEKGTEVKVV